MEIVDVEIIEDGNKAKYIYENGNTEVADIIHVKAEEQPAQLDNIEESQLIIMEAMADQYEQQQEDNLVNMEVQATIYEAILELGGNA